MAEGDYTVTEARKLAVYKMFCMGTYTHGQIAMQVGLSPETVGKILNDPSNQKLLDVEREKTLDLIEDIQYFNARNRHAVAKLLNKDLIVLLDATNPELSESERKHLRELQKEYAGNKSTLAIEDKDGLFTKLGLDKALRNSDPNVE